VTSIGDFAFSECTSLVPFNLPNSVTSIGEDIFKGCKDLKKGGGKNSLKKNNKQ
jgi:hypothetical protein